MENNFDLEEETCEECLENKAIVEIFIEDNFLLLCGSCRAEYLRSAANEE